MLTFRLTLTLTLPPPQFQEPQPHHPAGDLVCQGILFRPIGRQGCGAEGSSHQGACACLDGLALLHLRGTQGGSRELAVQLIDDLFQDGLAGRR